MITICHARHSVVQVSGADVPSGDVTANAAWLALTATAHNLGCSVGILPGADIR